MTNFTNKTFKETYRDFYNAEDGYHKVLFNAGRALQARELNESQTIIQEELSRLGRNLFREGALVKAGGAMIDNAREYVRIDAVSALPEDLDILVGKVYTNTAGVEFQVLEVLESTETDPTTLYVKYTNTTGAVDNSVSARVGSGEVILSSDSSYPLTVAPDGVVPASGLGTKVSVNESEFFILGHFVHVSATSLYVSKYSSTPTVDFGFKVEQLIITEGEDPSLYDNQGDVPNISSPGAHRYKIKLTPTTRDTIDTEDNFVYVCRIVDGVITRDNETNDAYNVLNDLLATRTKEESGDYVAKEFKAIFTDKDSTSLQLEVTEGTAYVDGYRLNFGDTFIDVPKSQDTTLINNGSTPATYGNYVEFDPLLSKGLSTIATFGEVELKDENGTVLGTAFTRGIETYGSSFRLFLFNIKMESGMSFRDTVAITAQDTLYTLSETPAQLYGSTDNSLLFPLPDGRPESISDMNYVAQFVKTGESPDASGKLTVPNNIDASYPVIISDGTNISTYDPVTDTVAAGNYDMVYWQQEENPQLRQKVLTEVTESGLQIVEAEGSVGPLYNRTTFGTYWQVEQNISGERVYLWWGGVLLATFSSVTGFTSFTVNGAIYTRGDFQVQESQYTFYEITKTPIVSASSGVLNLPYNDGIELLSVTDQDGNDLTGSFDFDGGQRDNFYDNIKLTLRQGLSLSNDRTLTVTLTHFAHTSGKYFSVASYDGNDLTFDQIPKHTLASGEKVALSDVLDFRPTMEIDTVNGTYQTNVSGINPLPRSNSIISADVNYYLPRIDTLVANTVDSRGRKGLGELQLIQGEPSLTPRAPSIPTGSMALFNFALNPYTVDASDLSTTEIPNKRFTMKDIANLEERVEDLYELTTLSLLEANTNSLNILDENGNNRTKAGFIADNFSSLFFADVENPNFRASLDLENGELRPSFREHSVRLKTGTGTTAQKQGDLAVLPYTHHSLVSQTVASGALNINPFEVITQTGHLTLSPASDEWVEVNRLPPLLQTTVRRTFTNNLATTAGSGIRTRRVRRTIQEFLGDRILDVEIIPFMRSRRISFKVKGLRPNTKMFPFFGTKNVSDWVRQETTFTNFSDDPVEYGSEYATASQHPFGGPTELVTNEKGELIGSFFLPNTSSVSFRTGTQRLELLDINSHDVNNAICKARANYTSTGTIETVQNTIRTTRLVEDILERYDPLAQTFFIDQVENPNGLFLSKVKVYVESKDNVIPMQVQIRPVLNGIPTTQLVPGSVKFVDPEDINVTPLTETTSLESVQNNGTEIEFDEPVYLTAGQEYAIVLLAESINYNVYVAETYAFLIGANQEARVSKQPTLGTLFMSQNGSTWTPDQTRDLMFELYRAEFEPSATVELVNTVIPKKSLIPNPISVDKDSTIVFINHQGHGFISNDSVTITGVTEDIGGIPAESFNGTHTVLNVTWEGYVINTSIVATSSAVGGGDTVVAAEQVMYDEFVPQVGNIAPTDTTVTATVIQTKGASYGGDRNNPVANSAYSTMSEKQVFLNDTNTNDVPALVTNNSTVKFNVQLSTMDSKVSPVIDLQRVSMLALENVIDENDAAQHITTPVVVEDSSVGVKIIFGANRPKGSELEVYIKTATDDATLTTATWKLVEIDADIPADDNTTTFREYSYTEETEPFTIFQVKIVMKTNNSSKSPVITDLRTIALAV